MSQYNLILVASCATHMAGTPLLHAASQSVTYTRALLVMPCTKKIMPRAYNHTCAHPKHMPHTPHTYTHIPTSHNAQIMHMCAPVRCIYMCVDITCLLQPCTCASHCCMQSSPKSSPKPPQPGASSPVPLPVYTRPRRRLFPSLELLSLGSPRRECHSARLWGGGALSALPGPATPATLTRESRRLGSHAQ